MTPKRGQKRKQDCLGQGYENEGDPSITSFNRENWSGWVEMESEPAFFNVMIKEIGVKGIKIQEVYSLEDSMLATLPQPIHALIFLFRYKEADWTDSTSTSCPSEVWFANQTPDFACATFAMLNIVNNIPDIHLGTELENFKTRTQDMNPLERGDAINEFTFVKKIHNSFASENDLLQADMFVKNKSMKLKRLKAAAKGRETKATKKAANSTIQAEGLPEIDNHDRRSTRAKKLTSKVLDEQDSEYNGGSIRVTVDTPRRSNRSPKPRIRHINYANENDLDADEEGFHFVAYMPIAGRIWKLDGLDRFPEDLGEYDIDASDWLARVQPALRGRMARYEGAEIEFNLMAVVHDNTENDRASLLQNIRAVQGIDVKLHLIQGNIEEARNIGLSNSLLTPEVEKLGLTKGDLDTTVRSSQDSFKIDAAGEDVAALLQLRGTFMDEQCRITALLRDSLEMEKQNEEKARHRRHNYGAFVRQWLQALANHGVLDSLLKEAE